MNNVILSNGNSIPTIGFGTLRLKGDEGIKAIVSAIKTSYRHIDTAQVYETEYEVGRAIEICIKEGITCDFQIIFGANDFFLQLIK